METSVIIVNYNMPERTDALVSFVRSHTVQDFELVVVDNGSDLVSPSQYTTVWIPKNRDTLGGWNSGLVFSSGEAVLFLSTSMQFEETDKDILLELTGYLQNTTVAAMPKWTGAASITHQQKTVNPFALWNRKWLKKHMPDHRLTTGWGSDFELDYFIRQDRKRFAICDTVKVKISEGVTYEQRRGGMTIDERRKQAREQMYKVLTEKYGDDWRKVLLDGTGIETDKL